MKVSFPSACLSTLHVSPEVRPWMLGAVKVNRVPHMGGTTSPDIAAKEKERAVKADHPARAPSCGPSSLLLGQDPQGNQTLATLCIASVARGRGVLGSLLLGVRAHWWQGSCQPFRCCCPLLTFSARGNALLCICLQSKGKLTLWKDGNHPGRSLQALLFLSEIGDLPQFPPLSLGPSSDL